MKNIIILSLFFPVFFSCKPNQPEEVKVEATVNEMIVQLSNEQLQNADIVTGKAELKPISAILKVNGTVDVPPQNMISISAPLGGYLKSSKLLPGTHVRRGESIAILEDQQYITLQQDYLTAKA